jgi:hypothetical protein
MEHLLFHQAYQLTHPSGQKYFGRVIDNTVLVYIPLSDNPNAKYRMVKYLGSVVMLDNQQMQLRGIQSAILAKYLPELAVAAWKFHCKKINDTLN